MKRYKQQVTQAASQVASSSVPTEEEQLGSSAQLAGTFFQQARQAHIRHKLAKQKKDPKTHAEPYAQDNPLESMLNLEMGHGVEPMRTPPPATGKPRTHVGQKFGSSLTTVNVPNKGPASGPSMLSMTTVVLKGAGSSTKYPVMASRSTPVHPAQASNATFSLLSALEAVRSGGRDQASVAAKMRLVQTGSLTPQEATDPHTHATFEQPSAQNPTAEQQRLIARNTGNTLKLWAHGPGSGSSSSSSSSAPVPSVPLPSSSSSSSSASSAPLPSVPLPSVPLPSVPLPSVPLPSVPLPSSSSSSSSSSSAPVPSVHPPGSPRGQRFMSSLRNMSSSNPPDWEDLHEANAVLSDVHGSHFAPMSPVGEESEDEAYEKVFKTKANKKPKGSGGKGQ